MTIPPASVETLPRAELAALQLQRLRTLVERAARVPLHRDRLARAGVRAADLRGLDDVRRLPFTTKTDFRDAYPYGLLAAPMEEIVRIHASSRDDRQADRGRLHAAGPRGVERRSWAGRSARAE